ncbi:MAG: CehA/McbA family metallohydrolase [Oscillospiraceae bacterium]|nr:CehA/McbA family metallohydrolase [Oscillospiraceae bacterium]
MYIDKDGQKWFKGNLHTHTIQSDGKLTPEESQKLYRDNGYDFIAITDHWKITETGNDHGILRITGCEYHSTNPTNYHIVGIGMKKPLDPNITSASPAQDLIDAINNAGGSAILAHPAWCSNTVNDINFLKGFTAVEILNTVCTMCGNMQGNSGEIIDRLAEEGYIIPCVASDDVHWYTTDQCRSFTWVKADELTEDAIIAAIKKGEIIASQGPFFSVERTEGKLSVESTPVTKITITGKDNFVRVELIDENGNGAWSTPMKV